jgi:transposase
MKKQRKHYTPQEKVAMLRRHMLEQVPISELCDKQGLQPTVFYRQKEFFENGAAAFSRKHDRTIQPSRSGSPTWRRRSRRRTRFWPN